MSQPLTTNRRQVPPTVVWSAVGVLLVGAIAPLALIDPVIPLFAALGIIVVGLAAFMPKLFAFIALLVIMFSVPLATLLEPVGRNADEIVIVLAAVAFSARRLLSDHRLVVMPGTIWFIVFIAMGLASGFSLSVPGGVAVEGLFLAVKGILFAFALAQLEWRKRDLEIMVTAGIVLIVVLALTAVGNLAAPVPWTMVFTRKPPVDYVGGIPSLSGPFQHPAAFGPICAVLAIAVFAYRFTVRSSIGNTILLLARVWDGLAHLPGEVGRRACSAHSA